MQLRFFTCKELPCFLNTVAHFYNLINAAYFMCYNVHFYHNSLFFSGTKKLKEKYREVAQGGLFGGLLKAEQFVAANLPSNYDQAVSTYLICYQFLFFMAIMPLCCHLLFLVTFFFCHLNRKKEVLCSSSCFLHRIRRIYVEVHQGYWCN